MAKNSIIIAATDYRYPTKEELDWAHSVSPELSNFGFESKQPIISLMSGKRTIREVHRDDQLQYWNNMLLNRNGALLHTYNNIIVHYQRGIPDEVVEFKKAHYINRIQFDYYLEYFYYQFSTVSDTIGQLLNVYFGLGLQVEKLHFNQRFASTIQDKPIADMIIKFLNDTATARDYRNRLTHRTPINFPDSRSTIMSDNGRLSYGSAKHNSIKSSEIRANLESTIHSLSKFLEELKKNIVG